MFREFKVGDLFTLTGLKQVKSQKNVVESDDGVPFVIQSTKSIKTAVIFVDKNNNLC